MAKKLGHNVRIAEPVVANAGVAAWYRDKLQTDIVNPMARGMLKAISAAWHEGGGRKDGMAYDAKTKPALSLLLRRALGKWAVLWTGRLDTLAESIATDFATRNRNATQAAMKAKLAKAGFTVKFRPTQASVDAYQAVISEQVGLIKSIPQKFLTDVQVDVWQSVMDGSDMETLSRQIEAKHGVSHRRAALIAVDQNHKAKATIERTRRLENGLTKAVWMHSSAGVTPRPTHVAMDGKVYDIADGMYDSAVQKQIWPGTEVNCRCTDRCIVVGFEP